MSNGQDKINYVTKLFFNLQFSNKLRHWSTTSFAEHKATDQFDDVLGGLMDKFMEVAIGRYQVTPSITECQFLNCQDTPEKYRAFLKQAKEVLETIDSKFPDADLLNIRDELVAEINKMFYLLRLN